MNSLELSSSRSINRQAAAAPGAHAHNTTRPTSALSTLFTQAVCAASALHFPEGFAAPEELWTISHVDENRAVHPPKVQAGRKMREEEDDTAANSARSSRVFASKSVDVAEYDDSKEHAPKLCGYLNKLVGKGPLKGFKTRWFVYDPRKCYLYYFKTPQDALPLGYIEIADASFTYELEAEEGQFEIRTAGKEFLLKVNNTTAPCQSPLPLGSDCWPDETHSLLMYLFIYLLSFLDK